MKKKISIDGAQNVEVSKPIPCEKSPQEQLAIMEAYTQAHRDSAALDKAERELRCLRTIFPALFRSIEDDDLLAGFSADWLWQCDQHRRCFPLLCFP